jgi:hypothetical protein
VVINSRIEQSRVKEHNPLIILLIKGRHFPFRFVGGAKNAPRVLAIISVAQRRNPEFKTERERERMERDRPVIGVDGVADGDVEGPVGAQQQLVGGLVHAHRRRGRHLSVAPSEDVRGRRGGRNHGNGGEARRRRGKGSRITLGGAR